MNFAIVGAGVAGLATAIVLKQAKPDAQVTIFDPLSPHQRTSALAQLLYQHIGMYSKLNWKGDEAYADTVHFLNQVQKQADTPFFKKVPLVKLASREEQKEAFIKASKQYSYIEYQAQTEFGAPAIVIHSAIQVNAHQYLIAMNKCCQSLGIRFSNELYMEGNDAQYDHVIITAGFQSLAFTETKSYSYLKGQALILKKTPELDLSYNLVAQHLHLIPSRDEDTVYVGNTFERDVENPEPDVDRAIELIWPKLTALFPKSKPSDILNCVSGIRLNTPSRLPSIGQINNSKWLYCALGSKGLLYHVWCARMLVKAILKNNLSLIDPRLINMNTMKE